MVVSEINGRVSITVMAGYKFTIFRASNGKDLGKSWPVHGNLIFTD